MNVNKMTIEDANPLLKIEHVTSTIDEIESFKSKVVFKSDNGPIIETNNVETSLLHSSNLVNYHEMNIGDVINILFDKDGLAVNDNGSLNIYQGVLSKAKNRHVFNSQVLSATNKGLIMSIEGLQGMVH